MRVITAGHVYELDNKNNRFLTQSLKFIHKIDGKLIQDGTTNEEVLEALIERFEHLNACVPDYHTTISITLLKSVLNHQHQRTAERIEQGIEGTNKETVIGSIKGTV